MLSKRKHPSLIKYMGSKTKLLDFVIDGINEVGATRTLVDLFSGSASLAGAVGDQVRVVSNDIQSYASVLADTYTTAFVSNSSPSAKDILDQSRQFAVELAKNVHRDWDYSRDFTPATLSQVEREQQSLINCTFEHDWHLFTKNYSGTWWSAEQCIMIDAIRGVAETYRNSPIFPAILSALMFAMAYTSIGTGHYAQFRDPKTLSNVEDILIYRRKKLEPIFERKFTELLAWLPKEGSLFEHASMTHDYLECLAATEHGSTVYADPPYCFVHYSRFYHAIETLVLYDYPDLQIKNGKLVKGRYREIRHQSPFSIRSQVPGAFKELFSKVHDCDMRLVLSYSNTGMIGLDELLDIAQQELPNRKIELVTTDYEHMTLGRQFDRSRSVKECLITAR
jgi:adenine-specific DNA-methyltransferase